MSEIYLMLVLITFDKIAKYLYKILGTFRI